MSPITPQSISQEFLIVGEGSGDRAFFEHLCTVHNIQGVQALDAGGTGKLEQFLKDLPSRTGFRKCKLLLVVGDNDDTPDDSFKKIRIAVKKAKLPVPDNPLQLIKWTTEDLRVAIMMLPFDGNNNSIKGCLETLLLQPAFQKNPQIAACIPAFGTCVGADGWTNGSHVDKFRLRALLAATFPHDPNFGLQYALNPAHGVIPLAHASLDRIVAYLRGLPAQAAISRPKP